MGDIFALDQLQRINRTLSRGSVPAADYREAMEKISFLEQNCTILTINRDQLLKFSRELADKYNPLLRESRELKAEKEAREKAWKAHYGKLVDDYNALVAYSNDGNREYREIVDKYNALLEKYRKATGKDKT
ncbi:hypothetical protein GOB86_12600 [Acetobacter lambici]|uniref:Uncharacterized protein n=1 Tax=Acetobacter lambici TaxID=1332824 RepID=A0ABT1F164_9PROT|nr:hypothetical protein [Acetobacter lambici]MCP1242768.1 hypothetical protein [Acetobacter lambici]MCP1258938.1 hypothetical protein [Acetobacter lambici]NHO57884.1 hypothetical protein [Acetobacter lambici]